MNPDSIDTLPESFSFHKMTSLPDERAMSFCQALSFQLLKDFKYRKHGDLISLGFWIREARLKKFTSLLTSDTNSHCYMRPRGLVFHITPGNVDVMFAYSWLLSLMCGNSNIVKLSQKGGEVQGILLDLIKQLLDKPEFSRLRNNNHFIQYSNNEEITRKLSAQCHARVIWGGDKTISAIKKFPIPPYARDITFSDRFSFILFNADAILNLADMDAVVDALLKDNLIYSQQACSSARLVIWFGCKDKVKQAQEKFWYALEKYNTDSTDLLFPITVQKMEMAQYLATRGYSVKQIGTGIFRIAIDKLSRELQDLHTGNGVFYELAITSINDIREYLMDNVQTCAYFGFERNELDQYIQLGIMDPVCRLVPIGHALDFDYIWDGTNLFNEFTRMVWVK